MYCVKSRALALVMVLTLVGIANSANIVSVVETGGDNEATDTIPPSSLARRNNVRPQRCAYTVSPSESTTLMAPLPLAERDDLGVDGEVAAR